MWAPVIDMKNMERAKGHSRNFVSLKIKIMSIVRIFLVITIIKLNIRNLDKIDLVSHPVRSGGVLKYIRHTYV